MKQKDKKKTRSAEREEAQAKKRFDALFRRGTEMLHRGDVDRAVQLLERAYQLDAEHVDTVINLGGAYILAKKFQKAVEILEPVSERNDHHAMLWTNLGAAYLGNPILSRDEEQLKAIAAFKRALEINPAAPHVAYNIGLIYRDRQELEEAVFWFKKAVQANPNDKDARKLIARLNEKLSL